MSTIEEAPQGLRFSDSAGDNLVNLQPADEFDARYKTDIDGLIWLGFLTDTFTAYGHTYTIKTLTRGERLAVTLAVKEYENSLGAALALEAATVAACLLMVDGQPIYPNVDPNAPPLPRIIQALNLVNTWYDPLLAKIYDKYSQLQIRQIQAFFELEGK
jgi:hypothetical protein